MLNFLASILFILLKKVNKIFINFLLNAFVNIILDIKKMKLECYFCKKSILLSEY